MGVLSGLAGRRVYLDSNIFVYFLEGFAEFQGDLIALFQSIDAGERHAVTSELTLAEVLVKPFLDRNSERQAAFQEAIQTSDHLTVCPVTRQVLVQAAELKSTTSLRLPDAIHVVTALQARCDSLLTNDKRLSSVTGIQVLVLSEVV
jgi:predicted nucleic acid-binding protein